MARKKGRAYAEWIVSQKDAAKEWADTHCQLKDQISASRLAIIQLEHEVEERMCVLFVLEVDEKER